MRRDASRTRLARFDAIIMLVGVVALVGSNVWGVGNNLAFYFVIDRNPLPVGLGFALHVATGLFLIAGVTSVHNVQKSAAGGLGRVAYWTLLAGLVAYAVFIWPAEVIGWLVIHVGAMLYGMATLSAGVLSRRAGRLLAVGPLAGLVGGSFLEVYAFGGRQGWGSYLGVLAIGGGLLGLSLSAMAPRPRPVEATTQAPPDEAAQEPPPDEAAQEPPPDEAAQEPPTVREPPTAQEPSHEPPASPDEAQPPGP